MTLYQNWDKADQKKTPVDLEIWQTASSSGGNSLYRRWFKRILDIILAVTLIMILALPMIIVMVLLLVMQGRPLIYAGSRMKAPGQCFRQYKFRTMIRVEDDFGATGAHKHWRISRFGRFLRRSRLDELPQLFNILIGDMSFVGPRPPLPEYVERFPALYAAVLQSRPGVTGLATLVYHRHEDKILAACKTAEETHHAYYTRCLPAKLKVDLAYRRAASLSLDFWIMWRTLLAVIPGFDQPRKKRRLR